MKPLEKLRSVYFYGPTWKDRQFLKAFKKLNKKEQESRLEELGTLIKVLSVCRTPTTDPFVQSFDPGPYNRVANINGLYEYRPRYPMRVVVRFGAEALMLTVTLTHDHDRMKQLIKQNQKDISSWKP